MKVVKFDTKHGVFNFEIDEIKTTFHRHPVVEILYSKNGKIKIETPSIEYSNVSFAIIKANVVHKVTVDEGAVKLLMVECFSKAHTELFNKYNYRFEGGIYTEADYLDRTKFFTEFQKMIDKNVAFLPEDNRVEWCLNYLNTEYVDYARMIEILKSKINLSDSRLSHIFKSETGISLKKYSVWARLKKAFQFVIYENLNLNQAALKSGFYDQAHLSKSFKQMLGINPSAKYNSRMIQEF